MEKIRTFVAKQNITMLKRSSIALLERNSEGLDGYCSHPLRFIVVQSSYPLLVMADANNVAAYRFHFRPGFFALISIWHTIPDHGFRTTPNGFPKIQILQHSPGTKRSVHSILEPQPEPCSSTRCFTSAETTPAYSASSIAGSRPWRSVGHLLHFS